MKHLSNLRKIKSNDSVSSGERKRRSPNQKDLSFRGSGTLICEIEDESKQLENCAIDRDSRVDEVGDQLGVSQVVRCT